MSDQFVQELENNLRWLAKRGGKIEIRHLPIDRAFRFVVTSCDAGYCRNVEEWEADDRSPVFSHELLIILSALRQKSERQEVLVMERRDVSPAKFAHDLCKRMASNLGIPYDELVAETLQSFVLEVCPECNGTRIWNCPLRGPQPCSLCASNA